MPLKQHYIAVSFCTKVPSDLKEAGMQLQVQWWYEVGFRIFPTYLTRCADGRPLSARAIANGTRKCLELRLAPRLWELRSVAIRRLKSIVSVLEAEANAGEGERGHAQVFMSWR